MKIDTLSPAILAGISATIFTRSDEVILLVVVMTFSLVTLGYIIFVASAKDRSKQGRSRDRRRLSSYLTQREISAVGNAVPSATQVSHRAFYD